MNFSSFCEKKEQKGGISSVKFSGDGNFLASASSNRTILLYKTNLNSIVSEINAEGLTGKKLEENGSFIKKMKEIRIHKGGVNDVWFGENSRYLFSGGNDSRVRIYDLEKSKVIRTFRDHASPITCVRTGNGNTNLLLSCSIDESARVYDKVSGKPLHVFPAHQNNVSSGNFSSDGLLIATSGYDGLIRIWDLRMGGKCLLTLYVQDGGPYWSNHPTVPVGYVNFSPNDKYVVGSYFDHTLKTWDFNEGKICREYKTKENFFSPEGIEEIEQEASTNQYYLTTSRLFKDHLDLVEEVFKGIQISTPGLINSIRNYEQRNGTLIQTANRRFNFDLLGYPQFYDINKQINLENLENFKKTIRKKEMEQLELIDRNKRKHINSKFPLEFIFADFTMPKLSTTEILNQLDSNQQNLYQQLKSVNSNKFVHSQFILCGSENGKINAWDTMYGNDSFVAFNNNDGQIFEYEKQVDAKYQKMQYAKIFDYGKFAEYVTENERILKQQKIQQTSRKEQMYGNTVVTMTKHPFLDIVVTGGNDSILRFWKNGISKQSFLNHSKRRDKFIFLTNQMKQKKEEYNQYCKNTSLLRKMLLDKFLEQKKKSDEQFLDNMYKKIPEPSIATKITKPITLEKKKEDKMDISEDNVEKLENPDVQKEIQMNNIKTEVPKQTQIQKEIKKESPKTDKMEVDTEEEKKITNVPAVTNVPTVTNNAKIEEKKKQEEPPKKEKPKVFTFKHFVLNDLK